MQCAQKARGLPSVAAAAAAWWWCLCVLPQNSSRHSRNNCLCCTFFVPLRWQQKRLIGPLHRMLRCTSWGNMFLFVLSSFHVTLFWCPSALPHEGHLCILYLYSSFFTAPYIMSIYAQKHVAFTLWWRILTKIQQRLWCTFNVELREANFLESRKIGMCDTPGCLINQGYENSAQRLFLSLVLDQQTLWGHVLWQELCLSNIIYLLIFHTKVYICFFFCLEVEDAELLPEGERAKTCRARWNHLFISRARSASWVHFTDLLFIGAKQRQRRFSSLFF